MKSFSHFVDEITPERLHDARTAATLRGIEGVSRSRLTICGLARNAMQRLPQLLWSCSLLGLPFTQVNYVIYENDSTDGTAEFLLQKQADDPRFDVVSRKLGAKRWPSKRLYERSVAMAAYRNEVREHVVRRGGNPDYVIVMDFDLMDFAVPGIFHTLGQYEPWDAVASFGLIARPSWEKPTRLRNYDVWTWREYPEDKAPPPADKRVMNWPIVPGEPMLPLASAFGGLAIYKMDAFAEGEYAPSTKHEPAVCEHVAFHLSMREGGFGRFFANPAQLAQIPN